MVVYLLGIIYLTSLDGYVPVGHNLFCELRLVDASVRFNSF